MTLADDWTIFEQRAEAQANVPHLSPKGVADRHDRYRGDEYAELTEDIDVSIWAMDGRSPGVIAGPGFLWTWLPHSHTTPLYDERITLDGWKVGLNPHAGTRWYRWMPLTAHHIALGREPFTAATIALAWLLPTPDMAAAVAASVCTETVAKRMQMPASAVRVRMDGLIGKVCAKPACRRHAVTSLAEAA